MPNYTKTKPSKILRNNFYIGIQPNLKIKAGEVNLAMLAVWETLLLRKKKTGVSDFETIYKTGKSCFIMSLQRNRFSYTRLYINIHMSTNTLQSQINVSVICLFGYKLLQFAKDNNKKLFWKKQISAQLQISAPSRISGPLKGQKI